MKATALFLLFSLLISVQITQAHADTIDTISEQQVIKAALDGKKDIIEQALKQGYDVNTADPEKRTLLMFASFNGHSDVVELLIKAGAEVNTQDQIGTSALMFAASGPSPKTVEILLTNGAKINMVDTNEHFSALMWAAAEGQTENVKLLLAKGADPTLEDIDGDTAESFAAKAGHTSAAQVLKETSASKTKTVQDATESIPEEVLIPEWNAFPKRWVSWLPSFCHEKAQREHLPYNHAYAYGPQVPRHKSGAKVRQVNPVLKRVYVLRGKLY